MSNSTKTRTIHNTDGSVTTITTTRRESIGGTITETKTEETVTPPRRSAETEFLVSGSNGQQPYKTVSKSTETYSSHTKETRRSSPLSSINDLRKPLERQQADGVHHAAFVRNVPIVREQSLDDFRSEALQVHNRYRSQHRAQPLVMDAQMNACAQNWAEHLCRLGRLEHRDDSSYGENCFQGYNSNGITGKDVVDAWYKEVDRFDWHRPNSNFRDCGHFTQVVWQNSKRFGIGRAKASDGSYFVVANYDPAGNYVNQYVDNVKPKGY